MRIKNWDTFSFVAIYHLLLIALLPFVIPHFSWNAVLVLFITNTIGGLSITVGYHRLFAHKTYNARPVFERVVLLTSTLAFQWSALAWSNDHRKHHKYVDTDRDPYSIKKGFWYAHMFWLFDYEQRIEAKTVQDLIDNPRVAFQHRHFLLLTLLVNLAVLGVSCLFMHPVTAFYFSVVLRIFCIHHTTWFINSLAHTWGCKTYARELTAVDNAVLAFLTFGEGYHNYHHAFATDYRNGIRWWHFDPTKWTIWIASKFGLASNLRRVDQIRAQKILVRKDTKMIFERLSHETDEIAANILRKLEELSQAFEARATVINRLSAELKSASLVRRRHIRDEIHNLRRELKRTWKAWVATTRMVGRLYTLDHAH